MQDPTLDDTPDFNTGVHEGVIPDGGHYESHSNLTNQYCPICSYDFENPECTWCGAQTLDENGYCDYCDKTFNPIYCWCSSFTTEDYEDALENNFEVGEITEFPSTPDPGDIYTYGDYTYVYGYDCYYMPYSESKDIEFQNCWGSDTWTVFCRNEDGDSASSYKYFKYKTTYEPWLASIAGKPVSIYYLFYPLTCCCGDTTFYQKEVSEINIPKGCKLTNYMLSYCDDYLSVQTINYLGTKQEYVEALQCSYSDYLYGINSSDNLIHCLDGDVCLHHNNVEQIKCKYENQSQHKIFVHCSDCGLEYSYVASHSATTPATCINKPYCGQCDSEYGSVSSSHSYKPAPGATFSPHSASQHKVSSVICQNCGKTASSYAMSHTGSGTKTCTNGLTCNLCKGETSDKLGHTTYSTSCTSTPYCSRCKKTLTAAQFHKIVDGTCTVCGKSDVYQISITRNELQANQSRKIIGSWNFSNTTTVHIKIDYSMEKDWDWIALTPSIYNVGSTLSDSTFQYLNVNTGKIESAKISTGQTSSPYKFTGGLSSGLTETKEFDVAMPKGSVVLYTDALILGYGATITVTPNND